MDNYLFQLEVDRRSHIVATYYLESKRFLDAVKAIAIGQSIGNPSIRTQRDSPELMKNHLAKILDTKPDLYSKQKGLVKIAFPLINFDVEKDGITQLMCALMGGQMDIDIIDSCKLIDVELPEEFLKFFKGPKFGMNEIQRRAKAVNRPLLGGIVKPKTGINVSELKGLVQELLEGGVDFIKEDEILGNPIFCRFEERVKVVSKLVNEFSEREGREIFYAPCINSDYPHFLERAKFADEHGMRAVHLNIWAGLSSYRALRELDMKNVSIFFQKSGDKVITDSSHKYNVDWGVICKLARIVGCDFIHAGMWGGYLSDSKEDLMRIMHNLRSKHEFDGNFNPTVSSLSCGSHPGLVNSTVKNFGTELMMNVGGAIHGHPMGTRAGARAMRQAMDCVEQGENIYQYMLDKPELKAAIEKWGYVEF
ncbi:hypothetical protein HY450_02425 [Candidatus Pacearchaeota archaeon]|nr:hypothetical protein [Candidatus Pacearchaeota archaeon]